MLQNAYFLAKIGTDTAENELNFAEILTIGRRVADHGALLAEARPSSHQGALACASTAGAQA